MKRVPIRVGLAVIVSVAIVSLMASRSLLWTTRPPDSIFRAVGRLDEVPRDVLNGWHSPPKTSEKRTKTSLRFFDMPMTGFNDLFPFIRKIVNCEETACLCGQQCKENCAVFPPTYCRRNPSRVDTHPDAFTAVILRHPVRRIVFALIRASRVYKTKWQWQSGLDQTLTLALGGTKVVRANIDQFVRHPCLDNGMTKMLAGVSPDACYRVTERTLSEAKEMLRAFDFVGIKENLRESAQLLTLSLESEGFENIRNIPTDVIRREIISPFFGSDWSIFCLEKHTEAFIEKSNYYDLQLYKYALNLFHDRLCESGMQCHLQDQDLFPQFSSPFTTTPRLFAMVHIPKTAGTAFLRVIRHFLGCEPKCICTQGCFETCPYIINQCGHTPFVPDTCKGVNVFTVVLLRNPVERVVSAYKHAKTRSDHCCGLPDNVTVRVDFSPSSLTLSQFAVQPGVANLMVKMLAGIAGGDTLTKVDEAVYEKAVQRLSEMSFIGLQEHYTETVKLFFHSLNVKAIPQPVDFEIHNARKDRSVKPTEEDLKIIREANELDYQLYKKAKSLFYKRLYTAGIYGINV
eukprot:m.58489 g.58489  ORF g.58489 m.58489 type:complete len:572 (+) comp34817_c0_seq4:85-1800(+)